MLRRLTLLLIVVAFTFGSAYAGWHPYGERYAIIVMGGHEDPGSQLYRWYWGDTGGMYRELISYGFAAENIQFFSYGDSANAHPDWVDGTSTIANIRAAYHWAESQCSAEDLLYIYWVDHGSRTSFLLYDGNITHAELGTLMQPIGAKQIIGAYNPCYSGAVIDDISRIGVITVTSQDPDHPNSWGWAGHWREALRGGSPEDPTDTNGDGYISMTEAYIWIAPKSQQAGEHSMYDDNGDGVGSEWGQPGFDPDDPTKDGYLGKFYSLDGWWLSGDVELACESLTPVFCRGKNFYFRVTTVNNTGNPVNVTMVFTGWLGFDCDPTNLLVVIPRNRDIPVGTDTTNYFFKVPNSVYPGDYSASVSFEYNQEIYFCCMNATIVQCGPWREGANTEWELVQADRPELALPTVTELYRNYPNPFNATTLISYELPVSCQVRLEIYNLLGSKVATLVDGEQEAGYKSVSWEASEAASGVYFYKLTAGDLSEVKRMTLLR